jgi:hypothetical protein
MASRDNWFLFQVADQQIALTGFLERWQKAWTQGFDTRQMGRITGKGCICSSSSVFVFL